MDATGDSTLLGMKLAQGLDDFGGDRKAAGAVPRINQFTAGGNIEHARGAFDEFGFNAE